jgi:hypothetical protein
VEVIPVSLSTFDDTTNSDVLYVAYCPFDQAHQLPVSCKILIIPDIFFWEEYSKRRCTNIKTVSFENSFIFSTHDKDHIFKINEGCLYTTYDIFASSFFMITGMEEILNPDKRDKHGRFTFAHSEFANVYIDNQLVNCHAETLQKWLELVYEVQITPPHRFTAVLTHDIDIPFYYGTFPSEVSKVVHGGGGESRVSHLGGYIGTCLGMQQDPYDTFSYLLEQEGKRAIPATYFILLSRENSWGLDRKKYARRLKQILKAGNEIGLHPGFDSFCDGQAIAKERRDLENLSETSVTGVRNHFLRFAMPETYHVLSGLGFSYDATMGFPDREGYRHGIASPFFPFDINARKQIDILEIPLIVMDGTLREYRNYSPEQAYETICNTILSCARHNGTLVMNWHNSFLQCNAMEWREVYENALDYLLNQHAVFKTCHQVREQYNTHQVVK